MLVAISGSGSVGIRTETSVFKVGTSSNFEVVFGSLSDIEDVDWEVLDERVATINRFGVLTPLSEGKTSVVVKSRSTGLILAVYPLVLFKADSTALLVPEDSTTTFVVNVPKQLTADFGASASENVTWESEDTAIAIVDAVTGFVTGKSPGTTRIIARSTDGENRIVAYKDIVVVDSGDLGVIESSDDGALEIGDSRAYDVTLSNPDAYEGIAITWSVDDEDIALVDTDGVLTALNGGRVTLCAKLDGGITIDCKSVLIVKPGEALWLDSEPDGTIGVNGTVQITPLLPDSLNADDIVWSVTDPMLATVSDAGVVSWYSGGQTTVNATIDGVVVGTRVIELETLLTSVTSASGDTSLNSGGTLQFNVVFTPSDTGFADYEWSVVDTGIASISSSGLVTGISGGETTVQLKHAITGAVLDSVVITLTDFGVIESSDDGVLEIGDTRDYGVTLSSPDAFGGEDIVWSVDDEAVAVVDSDGVLTALSGGPVILCAKLESGIVIDCKTVLIVKPGEALWLDAEPEGSIDVNGTVQITPILPDSLDADDIVWSVTDPMLATVSDAGVVSWYSGGQTTVNATIDGVVVGTRVIELETLLTSVTSASGETALNAGDTLQFNVVFTPADTGFTDYEWSVVDTGIASISSSGLVTGISAGETTVQLKHAITGEVLDSVVITLTDLATAEAALNEAYNVPATLEELLDLAVVVLGFDSDHPTAQFVQELVVLSEGLSSEEESFIQSHLDTFKDLYEEGYELKNPDAYSSTFGPISAGEVSELIEYDNLLYYVISDGDKSGLYTFGLDSNTHTQINSDKIFGMDVYDGRLYTSVYKTESKSSINIYDLGTFETGYRNDGHVRSDLEVVNDDYVVLVNDSQDRIRVASKNVIDEALISNWDASYILDGMLLNSAYDKYLLDSDGTNIVVLATEVTSAAWTGALGTYALGMYLFTIDENDEFVQEDYESDAHPATIPGGFQYDFRYSTPKVKIQGDYVYASYPLGYFVIYQISGGTLTPVFIQDTQTLTTFDVSGDFLVLNQPKYTYSGSEVTGAEVSVQLTSYDISNPSSPVELKKIVTVQGANADSWGGSDVFISDSNNKVVVRVGNGMFTFNKADLEE